MSLLYVGDRYSVEKKIGSGTFGIVHYGLDTKRDFKKVAIKFEEMTTSQLRNEYRAYRELNCGPGIAKCYWFGLYNQYNALVMDLLGNNLEDYFDECRQKFSLKTVLMLADQIITIIEYVHEKGLIHRDIKPENFVMGLKNKRTEVYLIDFGLANFYRNQFTKEHIEFKNYRGGFVGTSRYTSINSMLGAETSRRDDLESLAYLLLYFLRGNLPWQGILAESVKEKNKQVFIKKRSTPTSELCANLPKEFEIFLKYSRNLDFTETPDYIYVRKLFHGLFHSCNFKHDLQFDWMIRPKQAESGGSFSETDHCKSASKTTDSDIMTSDASSARSKEV